MDDFFKGVKEYGVVVVEWVIKSFGEISKLRLFVGGGYCFGVVLEEEFVYVVGEKR